MIKKLKTKVAAKKIWLAESFATFQGVNPAKLELQKIPITQYVA
jgi:hypothetical protein